MMKEIIEFKYLDVGKDSFYNIRHTHGSSYEILFVRSGGGTITVRDKIFPIMPGAMYFINGAEIHCSVPEIAEEYCRSKLVISAGYVNTAAALFGGDKIIADLFGKQGGISIVPDSSTAEQIDKEFRHINEVIFCGDVYSEAEVFSGIIKILCLAHKGSKQLEPLSEDYVSKALEYINSNLAGSLTLDGICEHVHLSRFYFCHLFKKTVGASVFEYIFSRRLSFAKKYLTETSVPISQVAELCGFSSFSYFGKMFKKETGYTPGEYRKTQKNNYEKFSYKKD